jgi:hypothetical protein
MIGLAKLIVRDRIEDALCAGSGTLVRVGQLYGLLTAAHVLAELPKSGEVGIIFYRSGAIQKQTIKMEYTDQLTISGSTFGPDGPDLGFLRLPQETVGWLKATNVFFNISKRRPQVLAKQAPAPDCVDAVVGMVDQLTKEIPVSEPKTRAMVFSAIFSDGVVEKERNKCGFDIFEFKPANYPDFQLPTNFEGVSGGGLWRIYLTERDGTPEIVDKRLLGVPFYQNLENGIVTSINCHGPMGIYGTLYDAIAAKWPSEV